jgi:hypothetical protein
MGRETIYPAPISKNDNGPKPGVGTNNEAAANISRQDNLKPVGSFKATEPLSRLENKLSLLKVLEETPQGNETSVVETTENEAARQDSQFPEEASPRQRSHTVAESKPYDAFLKELKYKKKAEKSKRAAAEIVMQSSSGTSRSRSASSSASMSKLGGSSILATGSKSNLGSSNHLVGSHTSLKVPAQRTQTTAERLRDKYLNFFRFSRAKSSEKVIESLERLQPSQPGSLAKLTTELSLSDYIKTDDDDIPDPVELLDRLRSNKKEETWRSPLITDEFYVMDYLFEGDVSKAAKTLKFLSGLSLSGSFTSLQSGSSRSQSSENIGSATSTLRKDAILLNAVPEDEKLVQLPATTNAIIQVTQAEDNIRFGEKKKASSDSLDSVTRRESLQKAPKLPKKLDRNDILNAKVFKNRTIIKFNSCSTLFTVDSTLFKPSASPRNLDITLKSVAYAISTHLQRTYSLYTELHAYEKQNKLGRRYTSRIFYTSDILSEKVHPIWKVRSIPDEVVRRPEIMQPPTAEELHQFLKQIFIAADLNAEIAIIALIYLERLMFKARVSLHGLNCFRAVLGSVMLASKVWDDQAVWNVDFKSIMSDLKLRSLNYLERWWLHKIGFDVSVKRAVFANYWFEVREVAEKLWGVKIGKVEALISSTRESTASYSASHVDIKRRESATKLEDADPELVKTTLLMEPAFKENENAAQRRISKPDLAIVIPRPLTEDYMNKISATTTYSQSRIRQTFSEALSAPIGFGSGSHVFLEDTKIIEAPRSSTKILHTSSKSSANSASIGGNSQSSNQDDTVKSLDQKAEGLRDTIASTFKTNIIDFGWGGSKLRKCKSEDFYKPTAPAASVL